MTPAIVLATVAAGGGAAVVRYLVSRAFAPPDRPGSRSNFPWAVLVVNVVGSAIGGAVLGLAAQGNVDAGIQLILLTGFCGGLTTFSTLSVETVQLAVSGRWRVAALSVGANFAVGIAAAVGAYALCAYVLVIA
ncbi:MAG: CrcB family protein [Rhodoglobus sp.]|nr:CrcB family protein [Rhodoglobus sp.]